MQNPGMFWFGVAFLATATTMFIVRHRVERFVYLKWKGILVKKRAIYAKAWTDGSLTGVALFAFVGLLFVVGSMVNQP